MTKQTLSFGSGIINSIIMGGSLMLVSWAVYQSSQVPVLEETIKIELGHVHKSMTTLNATAKETNDNLKMFNKYHTQNLGILSKAIADNKHDIAKIEVECDLNGELINRCMDNQHKRNAK